MTIDAVRLESIFRDCLYKESELPDDKSTPPDAVIARGVVTDAGFNPKRLLSYRGEILDMIEQWPIQFFSVAGGGGGGWSFLNAPFDRGMDQWGEQRNAEQLMLLGIALGKVQIQLPRELWGALPGGVPYFEVLDDETVQDKPPT